MSDIASKSDIRAWLNRAMELGATHMLVVTDTYDYGDFPVNVMPGQDVVEIINRENTKKMQKVTEVYSLSLPIDAQLNEKRAWHIQHE